MEFEDRPGSVADQIRKKHSKKMAANALGIFKHQSVIVNNKKTVDEFY